ncbi:1,4-dihydroxy-2-naphthoate octaprenyltransferase [Winogradskyella sp. SYSU M77433]|uniref:1,4-dihydroxy-2-naphthoate octaprenyltransferase n=1 Tax=Winogradskyella sp. SYSU M77433 TaxID=3042722 RepID=UPI0024819838|nr:1,4-dihydroxy-2-naphthoate octaprenyltransferase [Winogradskyella sp. SYSU M77433]MDH7912402.1 1,4-dihydroxy-2-naphthoate octaprenyltransferase [Winogradskyella sp. SYSU M77433]|tara:strand:- start:253 stop:1158 length:906 start_codon:yes stop_codon:yes gene_type:complete
MKKIKPWLSAMRLRTLPLSVSGIILGSCFAYYNGKFDWLVFLLAILTTVSLQILSNLANDYGDGVKGTDNDERVGPQRAIQSGVITPDEMFDAIKFNIIVVIILTISLILAAFGPANLLFLLIFVFLGGVSVYAALNYTMGDSPYGYRALGDVFVFIFFGLVSTIGSYVLYIHAVDHVTILPAISLGLLSVGVLNLNNMRDIESDINAGKITLAVKLGLKRAKQYHYFLIGGAMLLAVVFSVLYYVEPYNYLYLIAFVPLVFHVKNIKKAKLPDDFDSQLKVLSLSAFLFALLLGIGYILY